MFSENMPRKFFIDTPKNTKEHIEALYEEVSYSSPKVSNHSSFTTKEYIIKIYHELIEQRTSREREKKQNNWKENASIIATGALGVILIYLSSGLSEKSEFVRRYESFVFFFGYILSLIFIFISIEKSGIVNNIWKYSFVKLLLSILTASCVIYSGATASSILNAVFKVDASVFKFSLPILTGMIFFKLLSPILWLLVFLFFFQGIILISNWKHSGEKARPLVFLFCSLVVGLYSFNVIRSALSETELPLKAYKLAHYLDFNSKTYCENVSSDQVSIFLTPSNDLLLIDNKISLNEDLKGFIHTTEQESQVSLPENLVVAPCKHKI